MQYLFTNNQRSRNGKEEGPDPSSIPAFPRVYQSTEVVKQPRIAANTDAPGIAHPTEKSTNSDSLQTPPQSNPPNPQASPRRGAEVPKPQESLSSSLKVLQCTKNHLLKWSVTTPFAYYKLSNNFWINCKKCGAKYSKSG